MLAKTLRHWLKHKVEVTPAGVVYVVKDGATVLYCGSTSKHLKARLVRHWRDRQSQPDVSKLSEHIRRQWPMSGNWIVEAWLPFHVRADCGDCMGPAWSLQKAERRMRAKLQPLYCSEGAHKPRPPEQLSMLASLVASKYDPLRDV